ncbi:MAG TPA: type II toxin-antitoxin system prevent-host-death family antitoxin [Deltaproteobacteria bacterium]|nr:type II toxin-antitoxin system prevent-host-death family antitoxin [Deltaproteobacteria bacterium]
MKATAKDMRFKTKEILAAIERGEEVILTYRGKEKARMLPISQEQSGTTGEEEPLFGIWRSNKRVADVNAYLDELRGGV